MDVLPQASLFLGIIPALIFMFFSIKGYEGYYKDKTMFLTFIAGIITGVIAAVIELYTANVGIVFIVIFPILELMMKTMVLNLGRLQLKKETVIYGLSLGLGFGSVFTPVSIITASVSLQNNILLASVLIGSIGIILINGGTGVILGYGIYRGKLVKYFLLALVFQIPVSLWFFLTSFFRVEHLQMGIVVYGAIIYLFATTKLMNKILIDEQKRKRSN